MPYRVNLDKNVSFLGLKGRFGISLLVKLRISRLFEKLGLVAFDGLAFIGKGEKSSPGRKNDALRIMGAPEKWCLNIASRDSRST